MHPLTPVLVVPPAELPVSLGDVKVLLRVDGSDEDALITDMVAAATAYLDGWGGILGRCIVSQDWAQSYSGFPASVISLPFPDVSAVTITYRDEDDAEQTLASDAYHLIADASGSRVSLSSGADWPGTYDRPDAVTVTMTAGYGAAENVPPILRHAIKVLAAAMFEGREGQMTGTPAFDAFVAPYRRVPI